LDKNNEHPDWMTDLIHLFDSGILLIIDLNKKKGKKGRGEGGEFYS
jgi:hypothetical protein